MRSMPSPPVARHDVCRISHLGQDLRRRLYHDLELGLDFKDLAVRLTGRIYYKHVMYYYIIIVIQYYNSSKAIVPDELVWRNPG